MRLPSAALVAGFLATSNAFLVPPSFDGIEAEFKDTRFRGPPKHFKDLVPSVLDEKFAFYDLECSGCPFAVARSEETDRSTGIESVIWEHNVENAFRLQFDTFLDGLYVNGVPLFPIDVVAQPPIPFLAQQIRKDTEDEDDSAGADVRLSYIASILPPIPSPHEDEISLIRIELTILKMNEIPVPVDTIVVKIIKTSKDGYLIAQIKQIAFDNTPGAEICEGTRSWSVCRIKAIATDNLRRIMHATKKKAHKIHSWVKEKTLGCGKHRGFSKHPRPHHDEKHHDQEHHDEKHHDEKHSRPHHGEKHHRPHHDKKVPCPSHKAKHHKHHNRLHRAGHMIRQSLRFFVVPALLGVIGGLTASAIGMLVGQAIVYLWFRTYRNGQRGPLRIYEREIALIEEEQSKLLDEKDAALPMYEDTPAYEQTLSRDVDADGSGQENEKR